MTHNDLPSPDALRALLTYDPTTGALVWRPRDAETLIVHGLPVPRDLSLWNDVNAGASAICEDDGRGYLVVRIGGRRYVAQRVAWALYHGSWPSGQVRFVGTDRSDLSLGNLRVPAQVPKRQAGGMQINNRSGATGVHWRRSKGCWRARIAVGGQRVELGEFRRFVDAVRARREAEQRYGAG